MEPPSESKRFWNVEFDVRQQPNAEIKELPNAVPSIDGLADINAERSDVHAI